MQNTYLLVLTATITPDSSIRLARSDPGLRRQDYFNAFCYWLNHNDPRLSRILLVENSGADLADFRLVASRSKKKTEFVSLPAERLPPGLHYGYGELAMLDLALAQSRLRLETTHMIKVTGRLLFPGLPKLLRRLPANFGLAVDARRNLPFRRSANGFIPTQLLIASHDFYDFHLRRCYRELKPQYPYYIENLFFDRLRAMHDVQGILWRYPVNCEPLGSAAHAHKRYDHPTRTLITMLRAFFRVVAPGFWF